MKPLITEYDKELDIGVAQFYMRTDGIVHCHIDLKYVLELADAVKMMSAHRELVQDEPHPTIYTSTKLILPSKEARAFSAEEGVKYCLAEAYITNSISQQLAGRLYLKLDTPNVPTLITQSYEKGIQFLLPFSNKS